MNGILGTIEIQQDPVGSEPLEQVLPCFLQPTAEATAE